MAVNTISASAVVPVLSCAVNFTGSSICAWQSTAMSSSSVVSAYFVAVAEAVCKKPDMTFVHMAAMPLPLDMDIDLFMLNKKRYVCLTI